MDIVSKTSGQSVSQVASTRATLTPPGLSSPDQVLVPFWLHSSRFPRHQEYTQQKLSNSIYSRPGRQAVGSVPERSVSAPGPDLSDLHHYHLKELYGVTPSPYQILRYSRMFPRRITRPAGPLLNTAPSPPQTDQT